MRRFFAAFTLLVAIAPCARTLEASTLPPASFPDGATQYEILFVTSGTISPTSGNISTYNAFVNSQANAAGSVLPSGLTWNAVTSTQLITQSGIIKTIHTINAATNAPSTAGIPVYNTAGQLITNLGLYADTQISAMPEYNQFGNLEQTAVATGSNASGSSSNPLGSSNGVWNVGQSNSGSSQWISSASTSGLNDAFAIYALSAPIQIRALVVPEPAALTLLGTGILAYCGYRRLNRGRKPKSRHDGANSVS